MDDKSSKASAPSSCGEPISCHSVVVANRLRYQCGSGTGSSSVLTPAVSGLFQWLRQATKRQQPAASK